MQSQLDSAEAAVEDLQQYTRRDNIIINGLRNAVNGESEEDVFMKFVADKFPAVEIKPEEISRMHRLYVRPNADNTHSNNKPLIVRFTSHNAKERLYKQRKHLKGTNIFLNEQLTSKLTSLYRDCKILLKDNFIQQLWTNDLRIFVRTNGEIKRITSAKDVAALRR